jgi:tRNA(adenine34) deaminase
MEEIKNKRSLQFMQVALNEAKKAFKKGEVPVGAVIVLNSKIIAKAHNKVESKNNATLHAEIIAINKASRKLRNWRLENCELYVTLKPCSMCNGAIEKSRIKKVFFAADDLTEHRKFETPTEKIDLPECGEILTTFFKQRRKDKNK